MQRNTMSKLTYALSSIVWLIVCAFWYNTMLYRPIYGLSFNESRSVIIALTGIAVFFGLAVAWKAHRNAASVFANSMIPIGIMGVLNYCHYRIIQLTSLVILSVGLLTAIAYAIYLQCCNVQSGFDRKQIRLGRIGQAFYAGRFIMACCTVFLIGSLCVCSALGMLESAHAVKPEFAEASEESKFTLMGNFETVSKLDAAVWDDLGARERLDVLQVILDIESQYLPDPLTIVTDALPDHTLACYDSSLHKVTIDTHHLRNDDAGSILDSVFHELRHAQQQALISYYCAADPASRYLLTNFSVVDIEQMVFEYENYISGEVEGDELEYYSQAIEWDAREYGEGRSGAYLKWISEQAERRDN